MRTLVSTLEFGVSALDLDVVQGSLEALASLARQHYLTVNGGRPGIATLEGAPAAASPLLLPLLGMHAHPLVPGSCNPELQNRRLAFLDGSWYRALREHPVMVRCVHRSKPTGRLPGAAVQAPAAGRPGQRHCGAGCGCPAAPYSFSHRRLSILG